MIRANWHMHQWLGPRKGVHMASESSACYDRATIPQSRCQDGAAVTGQSKQMHGARIMLKNSHLRPHCLAHSPTRSRLALVVGAALACTLCAGSLSAAAE